MKNNKMMKVAVLASAVGMSMAAMNASAVCVQPGSISEANLSRTGAGGPYTVTTKSLTDAATNGFGSATIHYPTNATADCGRMPGIAVVPGYNSYESTIRWWGPRLASWGFVVITINTNSILDQPDSRATQLSKALDHIINDSTTKSMVNSANLGAIGWSMGGGGTLKLATQRAAVKAIIPQAPWYSGSYGTMSKPAFFIGCELDSVAPTGTHVNKFYANATGPKMKIEINDGNHSCANSGQGNEAMLGQAGISWMKRYAAGDTRYNSYLCAGTNYGARTDVSAYNYASCP